jgi:hypothetical protein
MRRHHEKSSREAKATRYYGRAIRRFVSVLFWLFILFLLAMGIVWAVPKIITWAFG